QVAQVAVFRLSRWQVERSRQPDRLRDGLRCQGVERGRSDDCEHGVALGRIRADMADAKRAHFTRLPYWAASSRPVTSFGSDSLTAISQLPCGSALTASGLLFSAA